MEAACSRAWITCCSSTAIIGCISTPLNASSCSSTFSDGPDAPPVGQCTISPRRLSQSSPCACSVCQGAPSSLVNAGSWHVYASSWCSTLWYLRSSCGTLESWSPPPWAAFHVEAASWKDATEDATERLQDSVPLESYRWSQTAFVCTSSRKQASNWNDLGRVTALTCC